MRRQAHNAHAGRGLDRRAPAVRTLAGRAQGREGTGLTCRYPGYRGTSPIAHPLRVRQEGPERRVEDRAQGPVEWRAPRLPRALSARLRGRSRRGPAPGAGADGPAVRSAPGLLLPRHAIGHELPLRGRTHGVRQTVRRIRRRPTALRDLGLRPPLRPRVQWCALHAAQAARSLRRRQLDRAPGFEHGCDDAGPVRRTDAQDARLRAPGRRGHQRARTAVGLLGGLPARAVGGLARQPGGAEAPVRDPRHRQDDHA